MMREIAENILSFVYLLGVFELARRAPHEVDAMVERYSPVPRWGCDAIWAALIAVWPVACPIGWLTIWLKGELDET